MRIRRYEIIEDSNDVQDRVVHSLLSQEAVHFGVELADIYEGELPIPSEIQYRKVGMRVIRLALSQGGNLKALGVTPEHNGVTVTIPSDKEERSILALLDTTSSPIVSETH